MKHYEPDKSLISKTCFSLGEIFILENDFMALKEYDFSLDEIIDYHICCRGTRIGNDYLINQKEYIPENHDNLRIFSIMKLSIGNRSKFLAVVITDNDRKRTDVIIY